MLHVRRLRLRGLRTSRLRVVQVLLSSQELVMEHWTMVSQHSLSGSRPDLYSQRVAHNPVATGLAGAVGSRGEGVCYGNGKGLP